MSDWWQSNGWSAPRLTVKMFSSVSKTTTFKSGYLHVVCYMTKDSDCLETFRWHDATLSFLTVFSTPITKLILQHILSKCTLCSSFFSHSGKLNQRGCAGCMLPHISEHFFSKENEGRKIMIGGSLLAIWAHQESGLKRRWRVLEKQRGGLSERVLVCGIKRFVTVVTVCLSLLPSARHPSPLLAQRLDNHLGHPHPTTPLSRPPRLFFLNT